MTRTLPARDAASHRAFGRGVARVVFPRPR